MAKCMSYLLHILVFWGIFLSLVALPLSPSLLISLQRSPTLPDVLKPAVCPTSCKELFHANEVESDDSRCACICPVDRPIFLTTDGICVEKFAECPTPLRFASDRIGEAHLPIINLPASGGIVNPQNPIKWKEGGIRQRMGAVNCSLAAVFVDDVNQKWKLKRQGLFELIHSNNVTSLLFNGTERESISLEGSVLQIKMDCEGHDPAEVCIGFRINGISASDSSRHVLITGGSARSELIALIVLAVLLLVTLFGVFCIWNVCWRMKKERLISEIQMQFLVHFKQQDEARKAVAASTAMSGHSPHMPVPSHMQIFAQSPSEFTPPQPVEERQTPQKRRLFFSAEFLDPHLMVNPPPVAEQFLFDLRKMIDMAKERIRMRRHVPQLMSILEEDDKIYQSYMRRPMSPVVETVGEPEDEEEEGEVSQESPRSGKSVDSGHDSLQSSASSESKDSDESSSGDERDREVETQRKQDGVRNIVNGFESRISRPTTISKIPTLSPRVPRRSLELAKGTESRPPSGRSPRPSSSSGSEESPYSSRSPQPPLPTSPPPAPPSAYKKTKSKGYAVFPVDSVLNKSLPRRPKREIPRLVKDS